MCLPCHYFFRFIVSDKGYDYLLNLAILSLTKEKRAKILRTKSDKEDEMYRLQKITIQDMWRKDLNDFLIKLDVRYDITLIGNVYC